VPSDLVAGLKRFRERHPYRQAEIGGMPWRYIAAGAGDAMLVLTGAACIAEMSWRTIEHFAGKRRVIAPDYPALDANAALVDGLAALLDGEGVERAHVLGGSYGGLVAQAFVRRHPERTASLVLSHTLLPDRGAAVQVARTLRWVRLLPGRLLRGLFRMRLAGLFPEGSHPELALAKALFVEILGTRLTKAQLLSLMRRTAELGLHHAYGPGDLAGWPGRILILMATDDPATPEPSRRALLAAYPQAQVRLFSGGGHATAVLMQDAYFAAIDEFLAAQSPDPGVGRGA
jgi:pimeloyl-ACP methyl ester carboxylesterase